MSNAVGGSALQGGEEPAMGSEFGDLGCHLARLAAEPGHLHHQHNLLGDGAALKPQVCAYLIPKGLGGNCCGELSYLNYL